MSNPLLTIDFIDKNLEKVRVLLAPEGRPTSWDGLWYCGLSDQYGGLPRLHCQENESQSSQFVLSNAFLNVLCIHKRPRI